MSFFSRNTSFFQLEIFDNSKSEYWHLSPMSVIMKLHAKFSYLEIFAQSKWLLHLLVIYAHKSEFVTAILKRVYWNR